MLSRGRRAWSLAQSEMYQPTTPGRSRPTWPNGGGISGASWRRRRHTLLYAAPILHACVVLQCWSQLCGLCQHPLHPSPCTPPPPLSLVLQSCSELQVIGQPLGEPVAMDCRAPCPWRGSLDSLEDSLSSDAEEEGEDGDQQSTLLVE